MILLISDIFINSKYLNEVKEPLVEKKKLIISKSINLINVLRY